MIPEAERIIERADELDNRIEHKITIINELIRYTEKSRRITTISIVMSALLALVIIVMAVSITKINNNTDHLAKLEDIANSNRRILVSNCELNNKNKTGNAELWSFILAIPPETPEQATEFAAIKTIVDRIFAPVDCNNL